MKKALILLLTLCVALPISAQRKTLFNFGWEWRMANEKEWRSVDLPHDFQFEQPWSQDESKARGYKPSCDAWYRKTFKADEAWKGKLVKLDIEGLMYYGDVYLNGEKIASNEYGYTGFEADMTKYLSFDKDNVVEIYANTAKPSGARWYTGGGLYRNVNILVTDSVHVTRHGLFISTPEVSNESASVRVQVEVDGFQGHKVELIAKVLDPSGKEIATVKSDGPKYTHHTYEEVVMPEIKVSNPELWSCENPALYSAEVTLMCDGKEVDRVGDTFGIRTVEFSKEYGFRLNGKKVFLKGVANHHDLGALGAASFDDAIERMMLQLKAFGFNHIRCSHNPYSESFCRIADRLGILVVDELIDKWSDTHCWGGRESWVEKVWYRAIPEWIKRDRNRPSVIMWSLGNELQYTEECAGYDNFNDWGVTNYKVYDQVVKRFDPTRKTTVAQYPSRAGAIRWNEPDFGTYVCPPELATVTDVASFNYTFGDYAKYLEHAPEMIIYQSEATTNDWLAPYVGMDREHTVGLAYWGAIEYWGESDGWPKKGWNYSFFSHTLQPYPQAYLVKSAFEAEAPLVHIGVATGAENVMWNDINVGQLRYEESWNYAKGSTQQLATFTNTEEVELVVNGKSLGKKINDPNVKRNRRNVIIWNDVPYGDGGSVVAIGYNDGKEVCRHKIETAGKPVALRIEAEKQGPALADGMSLQYFNVYAVDAKGRVCKDYNAPVDVTLDGVSAKIYAIDNGDHYTDLIATKIETKPMMKGFVQMILRSTQQPGKVKISATSNKLSGKTRVDYIK